MKKIFLAILMFFAIVNIILVETNTSNAISYIALGVSLLAFLVSLVNFKKA